MNLKVLQKDNEMRNAGIEDAYILKDCATKVHFVIKCDKIDISTVDKDNIFFIQKIYETLPEDNPIIGVLMNKSNKHLDLVNAEIKYVDSIYKDLTEENKFKAGKRLIESYFMKG